MPRIVVRLTDLEASALRALCQEALNEPESVLIDRQSIEAGTRAYRKLVIAQGAARKPGR